MSFDSDQSQEEGMHFVYMLLLCATWLGAERVHVFYVRRNQEHNHRLDMENDRRSHQNGPAYCQACRAKSKFTYKKTSRPFCILANILTKCHRCQNRKHAGSSNRSWQM